MLDATYLHDRLESEAQRNKTPYQAQLGKLQNSSDLRMFGSTAFLHSHKHQRKSKLSDRASIGVYVGTRIGLF